MAIEETGNASTPAEPIPVTTGGQIRQEAKTVPTWRRVFNRVTAVMEFNIFVALLILCAFLSTQSEFFLTQDNLLGVARTISITAIVATIFLSQSTLGRYIYAVGGNEE